MTHPLNEPKRRHIPSRKAAASNHKEKRMDIKNMKKIILRAIRKARKK